MVLSKRYCIENVDGTIECFRDGGFWYTQKGQIVKWSILGSLFVLFMLWFIGGYVHAKRRLKAGKPLLAYHRFLVTYQDRKRYGQTPQNQFNYYNPQNPYQNHYQNQNQNLNQPFQQRPDGSWAEAAPPPPLYNGGDAPPQYFAPPGGATKTSPSQGGGGGQPMEMGQMGVQQSGVVGGNGNGNANGDLEQGGQALPPRPPTKAKAVLKGFTERFRK